MYSNLYYLFLLLKNSLSLTEQERLAVFSYAKNNENKIIELISIFEDEQEWIKYIKNDYKKSLIDIWNKFKIELDKWISAKKEKNRIYRKNIEKAEIENNEKYLENILTTI